MSNPLQPKCIKILEQEFNAYVIKIMTASISGHMDAVACINGEFWGFEFKWKSDVPSGLQMEKINRLNAAGGRAYFIRSADELRAIVKTKPTPPFYAIERRHKL